MTTRELTNSMRSSWNDCHRKYKFSYVDCVKPNKESDALRFGTAFHAMLEVYWGEMLNADNDALPEKVLTIANDYATKNDDPMTAQTLLALFDGYVNKYLVADRLQYVCVSVESRFDCPLLNPESQGQSKTFHLSGKIDGIIADRTTGEISILEHKTTSCDIDPVSDYWLKLPIDGQVSGYYLGASSLGYSASACLYDVIRKPTIRPSHSVPVLDDDGLKIIVDENGERVRTKDGKKFRQSEDTANGFVMLKRDETPEEWFARLSGDIASNPDKYFARREIVRSESDLSDYLFDMWSLSKELIDAERTGRFSRNPNGCAMYGTCEFFDVCTGSASIDDEIRFTKKTSPNEEL